MPQRTIVQYPDPILRVKTSLVDPSVIKSQAVQTFLTDLMETLVAKSPLGAGLSANQIGETYRIFAVNLEIKEDTFMQQWFINPEIVSQSTETNTDWEGCLSFNGPEGTPDQWGKIKRASKITIKALDKDGHTFTTTAQDFYARLLQHELDHLNGILFIDKLESKLLTTEELDQVLAAEDSEDLHAG